jgi:hypothetical protein
LVACAPCSFALRRQDFVGGPRELATMFGFAGPMPLVASNLNVSAEPQLRCACRGGQRCAFLAHSNPPRTAIVSKHAVTVVGGRKIGLLSLVRADLKSSTEVGALAGWLAGWLAGPCTFAQTVRTFAHPC